MRVGQKQKKIDINIPKLDDFIHKAYINVARKIYKNVYLFEISVPPLQIQKHNREMETIGQECILKKHSLAWKTYGADKITERHRHRYEFNPDYRKEFADAGMTIAGTSPDGGLVEIVELASHPWFVAVQSYLR